ERDLAPLPRALSHVGRCLIDRELVGPRCKATFTAELAQLAKNHNQRVVCALLGEVLVVPDAQVSGTPASAYLKARRPQEKRVQLDQRGVALRTRVLQTCDPGTRLLLDTRSGGRHARYRCRLIVQADLTGETRPRAPVSA